MQTHIHAGFRTEPTHILFDFIHCEVSREEPQHRRFIEVVIEQTPVHMQRAAPELHVARTSPIDAVRTPVDLHGRRVRIHLPARHQRLVARRKELLHVERRRGHVDLTGDAVPDALHNIQIAPNQCEARGR